MQELIKKLTENARLTECDLAKMLNLSEAEVKNAIEKAEKSGVICGYKTIINPEKIDAPLITAIIELKVVPQKDKGFEAIAEEIAKFSEVESVYLMSGGYDLSLTVTGKNFKDVALFVSRRLAPLNTVQSTATHFILKKYKYMGVNFSDNNYDDRNYVV